LASDPKQLLGRIIDVSLMDISRDFSRFYIKLVFQITNVNGSQAHTKFIGHDTMYERIYRMVQRHSRRVDVIQDVTTKDGIRVRVKTIFTLLRRINTSIKQDARTLAREIIERAAHENTFEDFMDMVLKWELQQIIRTSCGKIYPLGNIEIRKTEILKQKPEAV